MVAALAISGFSAKKSDISRLCCGYLASFDIMPLRAKLAANR